MKAKLYGNIRRMTTLFIVGIIGVTAAAVLLRVFVFDSSSKPADNGSATVTQPSENKESGDCELNMRIYFPAATEKGDVNITNLKDKDLMRVEFILKDSEECILNTGLISPGVTIGNAFLNETGQKLENGVHSCIAKITTYDAEDVNNPIGTADVEIQVYIGEEPDAK